MSNEKLIDPLRAPTWKCFIQIYLEKHDFDSAVTAFEKIARERNLLSYRFKLISTLIQNNELEKVQKVLDISIRIAGEEETLYNAIFIFLSLGKARNVQKLLGKTEIILRYHNL